jgi:hypothetical protein
MAIIMGKNELMQAVSRGDVEATTKAIAASKLDGTIFETMKATDWHGMNAFDNAASAASLACLELVWEAAKDIQLSDSMLKGMNNHGQTALYRAATPFHPGSNIRKSEVNGEQRISSSQERLECVTFLLEKSTGHDLLHLGAVHYSPISAAASDYSPAALVLLLKRAGTLGENYDRFDMPRGIAPTAMANLRNDRFSMDSLEEDLVLDECIKRLLAAGGMESVAPGDRRVCRIVADLAKVSLLPAEEMRLMQEVAAADMHAAALELAAGVRDEEVATADMHAAALELAAVVRDEEVAAADMHAAALELAAVVRDACRK